MFAAGDEPIKNRIRWVSYLLASVSILLIARGAFLFLLPHSGQDFRYRWSGQQYVFAGIDPFWIAFWTSEHNGNLPPDLPLEVAARAGDPVNIVDPPWVWAYGTLLYWPGKNFARPWFLLVNGAALVLLIGIVNRLNEDLDPTHRLFCAALFFANFGFSEQLINGNYGILALAGIGGCFLALRLHSSMLAGAAFALAQIKMTIGSPLAIMLLLRRKVVAIATAGIILLLGSLWTSNAVGISVAGLLQRMLDGANRFSTGGYSLYQVFSLAGTSKKTALILCASL